MGINIFDLAMEKEIQMKELYLELINQTEDKGVRRILQMISDEEVKHYLTIKEMKEGSDRLGGIDFTIDAEVTISEIRSRKKEIKINVGHVELYQQIRELEKESEEFYLKASENSKRENIKKTFASFAKQEHIHYLLVDEFVLFVSRPEWWVESAEFSGIDMY